MKLIPFSFLYLFKNQNYIHQLYRYCFVGEQDESIKKILLIYQNKTQQQVYDEITDVHRKKLESIYGEHFIGLLFAKKLSKNTQTGGGGISGVLDVLNDIRMKKSDTDAIFLEPNQSLNETKYPIKNFFIYAFPLTHDDNVLSLQQKIQRYVRYSDNEFAVLEPDYQYLWIENESKIQSVSHKAFTSYDTEADNLRPTNNLSKWDLEKVEFQSDSLLEYLIGKNDTLYLVDYWNEIKGLQNNYNSETISNYLKFLFPKVLQETYTVPNIIPSTFNPSYLNLVNELRSKDMIWNIFLNESNEKMYNKISSLSGYKITQCIFKGQTFNKINQQLFLDKLHMNKKFVFAKWTTASKTYWGKIHTSFLEQIKTIQNWKSQNNLLRSIVIKLKLDVSDDTKYVTLTFRIMEDERTELSIKMNFKANMNVTLEIITKEYLPYVLNCVKELEKMCEFSILNNEFHESLTVYNITTEINVLLPNKSEIIPNKMSKIISRLPSHFIPYSDKEKNSAIYIKTHNYLTERKERILSYLRSNIVEYGANPPSSILQNISNSIKVPLDQAQLMYANAVKQVKQNTPINKILDFKPNGIKIKNLFDNINNRNTFYLMGITSEQEFKRLYDYILIISSLYYRLYVLRDQDIQKSFVSLSRELKQSKLTTDEYEDGDKTDIVPKKIKRIKKLTMADPERNGYKPPKGTPGYSRLCQHQPDVVDEDEAPEYLKERGFTWNENIGGYEKNNSFAISLVSSSDNKKKFYFCDDPEYPHIGVTDPSKHPKKMVTACCFKLNQFSKTDPVKKDLFKTHSGLLIENMNESDEVVDESFKKLYVYKDKPFVNVDRIGFLEKHLDIFLNKMNNLSIIVTSDERLDSTNGYFLKQGIDLKYEISPLIRALTQVLGLTVKEFKKKIYLNLDRIFLMLMDGKISLHYNNSESLYNELEKSDYLWKSNEFVLSCLVQNGVFLKYGCNIALFSNGYEDQNTIFFDKSNFKLNYISTNNFDDKERELVMLVIDQSTAKQYVYPICKVSKESSVNSFEVQNIFITSDIPNLADCYEQTFAHLNKSIGETQLHPRDVIKIIGKDLVKKQILNVYNKVSHIQLKNDLLIPVNNKSGFLYDFPYRYIYDKELQKELLSYSEYIEKLNELGKGEILQLIPKSIISNSDSDKNPKANSLRFESGLTIPLKQEVIGTIDIPVSYRDLTIEELDKEILERNPSEPYYDPMIINTNTKNYVMINYQFYRLHWYKYFVLNKEGKKHAQHILDVLENQTPKDAFRYVILYLDKLYDALDFDFKKKVNNTEKSNHSSSIKFCPSLPENNCSTSDHCFWKNNKCKFQMDESNKAHYLERIVSEMCMVGIYRDEIFGLNGNSVSEFWGENFKFEERKSELLFSSITDLNYNFEYFINSNNENTKSAIVNYNHNTIKDISSEKKIINKNIKTTNTHTIMSIESDYLAIFRLLANLYYYHINPLLPIKQRILHNNTDAQTKLAIEIRGLIFMEMFRLSSDDDKLIPFVSGMYAEANQALLTLDNIMLIIKNFTLINNSLKDIVIVLHDLNDSYYFMNGKKKSDMKKEQTCLEFRIIKSNENKNSIISRFDVMYRS